MHGPPGWKGKKEFLNLDRQNESYHSFADIQGASRSNREPRGEKHKDEMQEMRADAASKNHERNRTARVYLGTSDNRALRVAVFLWPAYICNHEIAFGGEL